MSLDQATTFLPLELLYDIADFLSDDVLALHNCSFLSKAWRRGFQRRVFSSVFVFAHVQARSLASFVLFLDSCPDLASVICEVHIQPRPGLPGLQERDPPLSSYELQAALDRLPPLRVLHIHYLNIAIGPSDHASIIPSIPPSSRSPKAVGVLHLAYVSIRAPGKIANGLSGILCLFSTIDFLRMFGVNTSKTEGNASPEPVMTAISRDIRKIETFGVDPTTLRVLTQYSHLPDLLSLCLMEILKYSRRRFIEYQAMIQASTSLRSIELWVPYWDLPRDIPLLLLDSCHVLEELALCLHLIASHAPTSHTWRAAAAILESLPPSSPLNRLHLAFVACDSGPFTTSLHWFDFIHPAGWDSLVRAIRPFNALTTIQITVAPRYFRASSEDLCHPAVVTFFQRPGEELFPGGRKYNVTLDVVDEMWSGTL